MGALETSKMLPGPLLAAGWEQGLMRGDEDRALVAVLRVGQGPADPAVYLCFSLSLTLGTRATSARASSAASWRATAPSWIRTKERYSWLSPTAMRMGRSATRILSTW